MSVNLPKHPVGQLPGPEVPDNLSMPYFAFYIPANTVILRPDSSGLSRILLNP